MSHTTDFHICRIFTGHHSNWLRGVGFMVNTVLPSGTSLRSPIQLTSSHIRLFVCRQIIMKNLLVLVVQWSKFAILNCSKTGRLEYTVTLEFKCKIVCSFGFVCHVLYVWWTSQLTALLTNYLCNCMVALLIAPSVSALTTPLVKQR